MYLHDAKNISCTLDKRYLAQRIWNFPDNDVTQTVQGLITMCLMGNTYALLWIEARIQLQFNCRLRRPINCLKPCHIKFRVWWLCDYRYTGKKEDFLWNVANKQTFIKLIEQPKCFKVSQAKGDADVQIAKASLTISSFKSITLLGEDIDLLVLLHSTIIRLEQGEVTCLLYQGTWRISVCWYTVSLCQYQMRQNVHRILNRREDGVQKYG